jgi:hypothetical protein
MAGFVRIKSQSILAVFLGIVVSSAFLYAAVEPVRLIELEASSTVPGVYYTSHIAIAECLAVAPKIGRNIVENNFLSFRLNSLRFFFLFGIYSIITAFSKSFITAKIQTNSINLKNTILLKLRI